VEKGKNNPFMVGRGRKKEGGKRKNGYNINIENEQETMINRSRGEKVNWLESTQPDHSPRERKRGGFAKQHRWERQEEAISLVSAIQLKRNPGNFNDLQRRE